MHKNLSYVKKNRRWEWEKLGNKKWKIRKSEPDRHVTNIKINRFHCVWSIIRSNSMELSASPNSAWGKLNVNDLIMPFLTTLWSSARIIFFLLIRNWLICHSMAGKRPGWFKTPCLNSVAILRTESIWESIITIMVSNSLFTDFRSIADWLITSSISHFKAVNRCPSSSCITRAYGLFLLQPIKYRAFNLCQGENAKHAICTNCTNCQIRNRASEMGGFSIFAGI